MKESTTYQEILEEGFEIGFERGRAEARAEGRRHILVVLGTKRLGEAPDERSLVALHSITDLNHLKLLLLRVLDVETWSDLLSD